MVLLAFCAGAVPARAQIGSARYSSIVIDAATGNVLSAASADESRYPASLTKLMTLYLLFEGIRDRRVALDEPVPVSAHAASMEPSKLGLVPGTRITVQQAILGLVTKSANDAAAALAELLGGTEERFAQMMTLRARALGMAHTVFRNASGLPDPEQVSTARDMAILARHLIQDFPAEYRYFSVADFVFHGRVIPNHDHMLISYPGADGLKTGYTEASGLNLVTSAVRDNVRLIGVVFGAASSAERDRHMAALLDAGFERMGVAPEDHPVLMAHLPGFVGSAHAATLVSGRVITASARMHHWGRHSGRIHGLRLAHFEQHRSGPAAVHERHHTARAARVSRTRVRVASHKGHTGRVATATACHRRCPSGEQVASR
jgi:D-alanyl-D-alanine carboxypeptidase